MKKCKKCNLKITKEDACCSATGSADESANCTSRYDSYYDDVPVADSKETEKNKLSSGIEVKIGIVVFGLLIAIAVCIAVLCLI